jgi:RNA polymerase-binding transcription factor DksA
MNISGISPWYFQDGQKREQPQKRGNVREAFDYQLNKYLEESSREPFCECAECGGNIFKHDKAVRRAVDGAYICLDCMEIVDTDTVEPERYIP